MGTIMAIEWHEGLGLTQGLIDAVEDPKTAVWYGIRERDFFVNVLDDESKMLYEWPSGTRKFSAMGLVNPIAFDPWSGKPLPRRLDDEHMERVAPFQPDDELHGIYFRDWPSDLQNDRWWRKEGIPIDKTTNELDFVEPILASSDIIETHSFDSPPGLCRANVRSPHACNRFMDLMKDTRVMIAYLPHTREYGIRVLEPFDFPGDQSIRILPFTHCPWCGSSLPKGLNAEWHERLNAAGLEPDDIGWPTNLPDDLQTDAWWRNAGL